MTIVYKLYSVVVLIFIALTINKMVFLCKVETCWGSKESKHRFPNPKKNFDLFQQWLLFCNNKSLLEYSPDQIYGNSRVCKKHFKVEDFGNNNRLLPGICPSKYGEDQKQDAGNTNEAAIRQYLQNCCYSLPTTLKNVLGSSKSNMMEDSMEGLEQSVQSTSNTMQMEQPTPSTSMENNDKRRGILSAIGFTKEVQLTPKKKIMYNELKKLKKKTRQVVKSNMSFKQRLREATSFSEEKSFNILVEKLNPIQQRFFKSQLENANKHKKARRFTTDDKIFALALSRQSRAAYRFLSRIWALPSEQTLNKLLNRIDIKPGFNDIIFKMLKIQADKYTDPVDKYCVLMGDEMSLSASIHLNLRDDCVDGFDDENKMSEEFADHAQVFMLRGIRRRWKQPIFYTMVKGANKHINMVLTIKELVRRCRDAGLIVVSFVSDQGSNNCAAINYLVNETRREKLRMGEDMDVNEFFFEIDGQKIIPLYDPPHLIKGIRNNMLTCDVNFTMEGENITASWEDIYTAYRMDPYFGSLRSFPRWTDGHVNPNKINKMKVSCCTQVLSHTAAKVINLMAYSGTRVQIGDEVLSLPPRAIGTAKFIELMDSIFDSMNSQGKSTKELRRPVTTKSPHFQFWAEKIPILKSTSYINRKNGKRSKPPSLLNTIKNFKNYPTLFQQLQSVGFRKMHTRGFNQDVLENFFGKCRQKGGRYVNPTPSDFGPLFKSLLVNNLSAPHSKGSNCEGDTDDMFFTLKEMLQNTVTIQNHQPNHFLNVKKEGFRIMKPMERRCLTFVVGFITKDIKKKVKGCSSCIGKIFTTELDDDHALTSAREYRKTRSLTYVSKAFKCKILPIYKQVLNILEERIREKNIIEKILNFIIQNFRYDFLCPLHENFNTGILKRFVKLLIHNYCKQINCVLKQKDLRGADVKDAPKIFKKAFLYAKTKYNKKKIAYYSKTFIFPQITLIYLLKSGLNHLIKCFAKVFYIKHTLLLYFKEFYFAKHFIKFFSSCIL